MRERTLHKDGTVVDATTWRELRNTKNRTTITRFVGGASLTILRFVSYSIRYDLARLFRSVLYAGAVRYLIDARDRRIGAYRLGVASFRSGIAIRSISYQDSLSLNATFLFSHSRVGQVAITYPIHRVPYTPYHVSYS